MVWPEPCWLVSLPVDALDAAAEWIGGAGGSFSALIVERDEVSLTLPESLWLGSPLRGLAKASAGPFRALTLDLDVALDVTGYLAPLAERLAAEGVSIVPQCAYAKDHVLVHEAQLEAAIGVVEALVAEAAEAVPDGEP